MTKRLLMLWAMPLCLAGGVRGQCLFDMQFTNTPVPSGRRHS